MDKEILNTNSDPYTTMKDVEKRYDLDPVFRSLVNSIMSALDTNKITRDCLYDAVKFAIKLNKELDEMKKSVKDYFNKE